MNFYCLRSGRKGSADVPFAGIPSALRIFPTQDASLFPISVDEASPLQVDGLTNYIRGFNQTKPYKLHVWTRTKGTTTLSNPVIVRFTIRDVLTAFITLGYSDDNQR